MQKQEILSELYALHRFGIKPGLERISTISEFLGNPHNSYKTIHIAGTNGKGSTSSVIASVLMEAGYRVGLYTSPHLVDFNERIRIDGVKIPDSELIRLAQQLLHFPAQIGATFFEITTAIAFKYFQEQKIDIAVIETGMGGRYDATNIIEPIVSAITSISLEHQEYLGDTIDKIAYEKAGIIKPNVPVVLAKNTTEVREEIFKIASRMKDVRYYYAPEEETVIQHQYHKDLTTEVCINFNGNLAYTNLPLPGEHQVDNLELAITTLMYSGLEISLENVMDGIKNLKSNTDLHTRIELLSTEPMLIIDSSHNEAAVARLIETLDLHLNTKTYDFVFAIMKDKDISKILDIIKPVCRNLIITKPEIDRAANVKEIEELALKKGFTSVAVTTNTKSALSKIDSNYDTIIVGSFYLTGEMIALLNKI